MAQRRLAAIMFTDIVGYDSLLKEDEKKAFDTHKKNQRIHRRLIKKFNGRWLKEMESGTLASFSSNIDAVMCAVSIQNVTEKLDILLRTGIHEGDIIFEKKDVLGDGVNIASRIQNAINKSGIVVSEKVYSDIKNKEGLKIESLGSQTLKGVDAPIGIYSVACHDESALDFAIDTGELIRPLSFGRTTIVIGIMVITLLAFALYYFLPKVNQSSSELGRSLLVLPFNNYLGTDTLEYFVAGMHDALISDIQKISAFNVKSKTTANAFKSTNKSIPEIASELGVNTFVEGAVLCIGDSICLQVKLFDKEENELWIHDFKVEKSEILNLYNMVTKKISDEINIILTPEQEKMLAESRLINPNAYDAYLRGMYCLDKGTKADLDNAMGYFQQALKIDSKYASAYFGIASAWGLYSQHGFLPRSITDPKREEAIRKAQELDNTQVDEGKGIIREMYRAVLSGDWEATYRKFSKIIDRNPKNARTLVFYGHFMGVVGQPIEGLTYSYRAIELDSLSEFIQAVHVVNLKNARKYNEALQVAQELLKTYPNQVIALPALWAVYHEKGEYTEAFNTAKKIYTIKGNDLAIEEMEAGYIEGGYTLAMQRIAEKMIACQDSVYFPPWQISTLYTRAGLKKEALDWLWKAFEEDDHNVVVIGLDPLFDILRDEPRFKELVRKMNLPND
jgi:class 3 adenylate cyclase/TolB-like protein